MKPPVALRRRPWPPPELPYYERVIRWSLRGSIRTPVPSRRTRTHDHADRNERRDVRHPVMARAGYPFVAAHRAPKQRKTVSARSWAEQGTSHHCFYRALIEGARHRLVADESARFTRACRPRAFGYRPLTSSSDAICSSSSTPTTPSVPRHLEQCRKSYRRPGRSPCATATDSGAPGSVAHFQADGAAVNGFIVHSRDVGARKLLRLRCGRLRRQRWVFDRCDRPRLQQHAGGDRGPRPRSPPTRRRPCASSRARCGWPPIGRRSSPASCCRSRASQSDDPSSDANEVIADFRPILDRRSAATSTSACADAVPNAGGGQPQRARSGADQPGRERARRHARRRRARSRPRTSGARARAIGRRSCRWSNTS